MHRFGSNWTKIFATSLTVIVALAVGPAAATAASSHSRTTGSDVQRLIDDASYIGTFGITSTDQKKLLDDTTFRGPSGIAGTDQQRLLDDANYLPPGHHPIEVAPRAAAASAPVLAMHGASWLAVWALAAALAVSLALLTTSEWRRRRRAFAI
jgi:hypothetical protein